MLTLFWPNFKGRVLAPSLVDANCRGDIVQATFVLTTFVHIRNISVVTYPILIKFLWTQLFKPNFLGTLIFRTNILFRPKFCWNQTFLTQIVFRPKIFWTKFIWRKYLGQNMFRETIVLDPTFKKRFDPTATFVQVTFVLVTITITMRGEPGIYFISYFFIFSIFSINYKNSIFKSRIY